MKLVRGAWKLLVGIKDALVLVAMLLFFGALFTALSAKSGPASVRDGALLLDLKGQIVEQPTEVSPFQALSQGNAPRQYRLRDVVRAIDAARSDDRVKAVVLDLDQFGGGYPAAISEVGDALARVRASGKPVLAYATAYTDSGYRLASNASEIWLNPMGGTLFMGPGGSMLYYKGLIDKLGINVHVYRVGKFKSYVEPYTRADASPEAKQADQALYGSLFEQWKQAIAKARPKAQIEPFLVHPDQAITAANGDIAKANLASGLVDKLGDRTAFGKRVAEIAGFDKNKAPGNFNTIDYDAWLDNNPVSTKGGAIGVLTVAGDIVDGKAPAGTAGGDTIAHELFAGLEHQDLKALVIRVDSPGGSAIASERIRLAIAEAKARGIPVVTSMGSLAASGGYWVSTAGDTIFAEPNTITGSIGIFGLLVTVPDTLAKLGIHTDGIGTTPLAGTLDIRRPLSPQLEAIITSVIRRGYSEFIGKVAQARGKTAEEVDAIAQGRVWSGAQAKERGLVDKLGGLGDAIAAAASRAKLGDNYSVRYVEQQLSTWERLALSLSDSEAMVRVARWTGLRLPAGMFGSGELQQVAATVESLRGKRYAAFAHCFCELR